MSDPVSETMIEADALSRVYCDGDRRLAVFSDVHLTVRRGEAVAIVGPSGSGKTTLLNVLSGLDVPTAGRVKIDGLDVHRLDAARASAFRARTIGFVFQQYHLLAEFTAQENVMLPMLVAGRDRAQARSSSERLLDQVGLGARRGHYPAELSGGEQQRAAIARALANDPPVLLCDEPTGNLDAETAGQIAALLNELVRAQGRTLVVVTHDERTAAIADRTWNLVTKLWHQPQTREKR